MNTRVELRFRIDAFSPETIPLAVLVDYLSDLATILGEPHGVHLNRIENGSTAPVLWIDQEAQQNVFKQARAVQMNEGPQEALRAKRRLEARLVEHNAKDAELRDEHGAKLLSFRGRGDAQETYGPVRQTAEIVGWVIMIGGKNDPVPVHIEDGDRIYVCEARRDVAARLGSKMFTVPIRATGSGKYFRNDQGQWELQEFRIKDFEILDDAPFGAVLNEMRRVKSKWLDSDDPLARLHETD